MGGKKKAESEAGSPRVESVATIKSCEIKPECAGLKFDGFQFSPNQYEQISVWVQNGVKLRCIMEPLQEALPLAGDAGKAAHEGHEGHEEEKKE
jgi:hypothetical protein